jgi:hypothetical protein
MRPRFGACTSECQLLAGAIARVSLDSVWPEPGETTPPLWSPEPPFLHRPIGKEQCHEITHAGVGHPL